MLGLLRMVASSDKLDAGHSNDALKNPGRLVARLQTAVTLSRRCVSFLNAVAPAPSAEGRPQTEDAGDGGGQSEVDPHAQRALRGGRRAQRASLRKQQPPELLTTGVETARR
jgi:hypothetical protein